VNIKYDKKTDTLTIFLKHGKVAESDEEKKGTILDYDDNGDLIGLEILDASKRIPEVSGVEFHVTG
jgi:uncharacterized protein YuzE